MSPSRKQRVFLIVEAGEIGLSTRKLILETAGFNVLSAVTARQGLDLSAQHPTDAVLFDTDVHDLAPADAIRSFKQEHPQRPVYLLASRPWPPDELRGLVDGVFEKMDDPRIMVAALEQHFDHRP